jgi:hypothetical protein
MTQNVFTTDRLVRVFEGNAAPSQKFKVIWDFNDIARIPPRIDPSEIKIFERFRLGSWKEVGYFDASQVVLDDGPMKGAILHKLSSKQISRGDVYEVIAIHDKENVLRDRGDPQNSDLETFKELARLRITTITKLSRLPVPDGPFITDARGTFFSLNIGVLLYHHVDVWLTEQKVVLDANGFIDPAQIEVAKGLFGATLHTNERDINGNFTVIGKYPSKSYHVTILFRDSNGSYLYIVDGEGFFRPGKTPAMNRISSCRLIKVHTVDDGDSTDVGELMAFDEDGHPRAQITIREKDDPTPTAFTWYPDIFLGNEISIDSGTDLVPENGNFRQVHTFGHFITEDKLWKFEASGFFYEVDTAADEYAGSQYSDGSIVPIIGLNEADEIVKLIKLEPLRGRPLDTARFNVLIGLKCKYNRI